MVVKPVAVVVAGALVVLGSAVGTYFAVRENRAMLAPASADVVAPESVPSPVESTDQLIETVVPPEEAAEPTAEVDAAAVTAVTTAAKTEPAAASVVLRNDSAPTVPAGRTDRTTPDPTASAPDPAPPATASSAPERGADELPPVEGWRRLPERWPTDTASDRDVAPERVALGSIDADALGVELPPEEQPPVRRHLLITANSVIGLRVDTPVTTEDAVVEDDVEARVTRDVMVEDEVAIPAGTRVLGSVVLVEQTGQLRGSARLGVRFHTVVLDEIVEVPITTDTVYREGKGLGNDSAAKIGGAAVGGAILGALFGGRQGAAIGGAAGAAGGTAAAMAGNGQPATLPAGSTLTIQLSHPATVTIQN